MSSKRKKRNKSKVVNPSAKRPLKVTNPTVPLSKPSKRRIWIFRITALILAPLLFIALLEIGLRLGGYGYPVGFYLESDKTGEYKTNPRFGWRFFPRDISRSPVQELLTAKPAGTIRIFILGGSAAQGIPSPAFSFGRILEVMLQERYPDANFEVVNAAMTAINSHVTLEIARDCAAHQPDLFVVYLGNNEVVGPYGPGTVFQKGTPSLPLIRANFKVKSMRTGQLLNNAMGLFRREVSPAVWEGMEMFLGNPVEANDPQLEEVYDNFRRNLSDIFSVSRDAGAAVLVSTVAVNLKDCPPFASRHRADISDEELEKWESEYQAGIELENNKLWQEALVKYELAARLDDRFAELRFRMGRCLAAESRFKEARESFLAACDLDVLRFRADTRINQAIREVAAAQNGDGVYYVDAEQSLASSDLTPIGVPGNELYYEHVHFNFDGNYHLARTVFDQVETALPQLAALHKTDSVLSKQQCAEALVLTLWDERTQMTEIMKMTSRPPFSNQLDHATRIAAASDRIESLRKSTSTRESYQDIRRIYEAALEEAPDDWILHQRFGRLLLDGGELELASEHLHIALKKNPWELSLYNDLGKAEYQNGRFDEAAAYCGKFLEIYPNNTNAHINLGSALESLGRIDEASAHYLKALDIDPNFDIAHSYLGNMLARQGRGKEAITHYRKALDIKPGDAMIHYNLGINLASLGRIEDAISHLEKAVDIESGNAAFYYYLGKLLVVRGRVEEARYNFRQALNINPDFAAARKELQSILTR